MGDTEIDRLWSAHRELGERCTELEERVSNLENDCDSDGIIDVYPDEEGCYCADLDSDDLTREEYLAEIDGDGSGMDVEEDDKLGEDRNSVCEGIDEHLTGVDRVIPPLNEEEDDHPHAYLGRG